MGCYDLKKIKKKKNTRFKMALCMFMTCSPKCMLGPSHGEKEKKGIGIRNSERSESGHAVENQKSLDKPIIINCHF